MIALILRKIEKEISEEIYCIAKGILEIETIKTKGKIRGIVYKYIMERFAREEELKKYGLKLAVNVEIEAGIKEATFKLDYP